MKKRNARDKLRRKQKTRNIELLKILVILFIGVFILRLFLSEKKQSINQLHEDIKKLEQVINSKMVVGDEVKEDMLLKYAKQESINLRNYFCIYCEDLDGNLVRIDGLESGVGSKQIQINGNPCGI